jgi:antitoxin ParD1/3/4
MDRSEPRQVSLTPDQDRFVRKQIESGRYASADEVVAESLRLLQEREEFLQANREEIREMIEEGYADIEAGRVHDAEEVFAELDRLDEEAKRAEVGRKIDEGAAAAERGEFIDGDEFFREWRNLDEEARRKQNKPDP